MKKLFISQPMRDKTDEEIKAERAEIVKRVTERFGEVEVIDSFLRARRMTQSRCGFWVSHLSCCLPLIVPILQRVGRITEGAMEHEACVQYGIDIVGE